MRLAWITEALVADATTYGHVFDIGQFKHDPQRKRDLEQQCLRGDVVKVRAMFPWFLWGTCVKTCYVFTGPGAGPWHHAPHEDGGR
jgi:hypothetical protein